MGKPLSEELVMRAPTTEISLATSLKPGKNGNRRTLNVRLRKLGFQLNAWERSRAYKRFLKMIAQKTLVTDDDLIYIAEVSKETPVAI